MTSDKQAIRDLVATWMAASAAGDLDTLLSLMADDVVFLVPGQAPFGKDEFAERSRGMDGVHVEGSAEIEEIEVLGDWAFLRNRLTITVTPDGSGRRR